jgi:hypothetical protein
MTDAQKWTDFVGHPDSYKDEAELKPMELKS